MTNIKIPLKEKHYFLLWYKQLQTQAESYNIKLRSMKDINKLKEKAIMISSLVYYPSVELKIGQLLLNKFTEKDIITDNFKEGHKTLEICKNGFQFLDTFIREIHPVFTTTLVITKDIPKFSNYKNIYEYCRGVDD